MKIKKILTITSALALIILALVNQSLSAQLLQRGPQSASAAWILDENGNPVEVESITSAEGDAIAQGRNEADTYHPEVGDAIARARNEEAYAEINQSNGATGGYSDGGDGLTSTTIIRDTTPTPVASRDTGPSRGYDADNGDGLVSTTYVSDPRPARDPGAGYDADNGDGLVSTTYVSDPRPATDNAPDTSRYCGEMVHVYNECIPGSNQAREVYKNSCGDYETRNPHNEEGNCGYTATPAPSVDNGNVEPFGTGSQLPGIPSFGTGSQLPGIPVFPRPVAPVVQPVVRPTIYPQPAPVAQPVYPQPVYPVVQPQPQPIVYAQPVYQPQPQPIYYPQPQPTPVYPVVQPQPIYVYPTPSPTPQPIHVVTQQAPIQEVRYVQAQVQEVKQPVVVQQVPVQAQELPKTGLPVAAWFLSGLMPVGARLRRFGKGEEGAVSIGYKLFAEREMLKY